MKKTAVVVAAMLTLSGFGTSAASAETFGMAGAEAVTASTAPCSPNGVTAADNASATVLRARLTWITGYHVSCARAVVNQVRARGLSERAAQIAITTVITETHLNNYDVALDHDSLGLFQQRPSMGWGTASQLIDPVYATNAFLDAMMRAYPNGTWNSGDIATICQAVQRSAYADGSNYRANIDHAVAVVSELWSKASSHDFTGDGRADIAAIDPSSNLVLFSGDGAGHVGWGGAMWPGSGEWTGYRAVAAADFTSDGRTDVAAIDPGNNLVLFAGDGAGHVGWGGAMWPGSGQWAGYKAITAADFTGDGRADIAAIDPGDNLVLFAGDGAGHVGWGGAMWPGSGQWAGYKAITAADFTGDGRADIAAIDPGSNLVLFSGDGAGHVGWGGAMWPGTGEWTGYRAIA